MLIKVCSATQGFPTDRIYCDAINSKQHSAQVAEEIEKIYKNTNKRMQQGDPNVSTKYLVIDVRVVQDLDGRFFVEDHSVWQDGNGVNRP